MAARAARTTRSAYSVRGVREAVLAGLSQHEESAEVHHFGARAVASLNLGALAAAATVSVAAIAGIVVGVRGASLLPAGVSA
jgi:hypothetical protein